jgi:ferredoxin-NADP reductase
MFNAAFEEVRAARLLRVGLMALWVGLLLAVPASGQVSSEEHKKHHPGTGQASPPFAPGGPPAGAGPGMMGAQEGMGGMMRGMGATPPKEQYPSLMSLPELTPERREEILGQAHARIQEGAALLGKGLDQLAQSAETEDSVAMQEALAQVREGLSRLESGLAAKRAVAEGQAPRDIALQWFKREMNLTSPQVLHDRSSGPLGLSWFHFFTMVILIGFAAVMIWMYYHKMQRAASLLQSLTGGTPPAAGAGPALGSSPAPAPLPDGRPAAPAAPHLVGDSSPAAPGKWSGRLRVSRTFQETPNVKTFRLMNPLGGVLPFAYLPGQFLTVTVAPDGKPVKRSYTIASSPTQHDYAEITVKHEEPGQVSGFLHNRVREGDLLEVSGPSGAFTFTGRECKCILLIGGGVGITPMMSVIRYLTDRAWSGDMYLLYVVHAPSDIIFREELEYLPHRHPNLRVVVTVSHPEGTDWKGTTGRITKELIVESVPDVASRYVHICGPVPMMEAVKKVLAELGVPMERVKTEAFGLALGKPQPTQPQVAPPATAEEKAARVALPTVTFARSNKSAPLPPDKVILDVADEVGVEIDNSCRVGTCGTCRVKLLSGQVSMAVEDGLEPGDKENHIILACQAKSTGNLSVEA